MANVKCEVCQRAFSAGETCLSDPLNEELLNLRDKENAAAAIRAAYSFRHGAEYRTSEIPPKWFRSALNAYRVFKGTTQQAVLLAWPWCDVSDRLENARLTYCLWQNNQWQTIEELSIVPELAEVSEYLVLS